MKQGPQDSSKLDDVFDYDEKNHLAQVLKDILFSRLLDNKSLVMFSTTCKPMLNVFSHTVSERKSAAAIELLQAVVYGDENKAKQIIQSKPGLLLNNASIVKDYSGRTIKDLTPFQAALCAGDVEMCEMMKKVGFSQLENGQEKLQKQFDEIFPLGIDAHIEEQEKKVFDFDTILQAIKNAPDAEVTEASYKNFDADLPLIHALNEFRRQFKEKSLNEKVFNPFHLLKTLEIYDGKFDNLVNWKKLDLFWRQVIGYTQRYLPACYAQVFAQGLDDILEKNEPLNRSFKFTWGKCISIYPLYDSSGLGFDFGVDGAGGPIGRAGRRWDGRLTSLQLFRHGFRELCQAKIPSFQNLRSRRRTLIAHA